MKPLYTRSKWKSTKTENKKNNSKSKLIVSISLIALGAIIAIGLITSFVFFQIKSSVDSHEVEKIAESYIADKSKTEDETGSTIGTEKSTDENNSSPISDGGSGYSVGKMVVNTEKLYEDSVAYNEKLQKTQSDYLTSSQSYTYAALNLNDYGITNGIYAYISAPSIGMEIPIYLGANDGNMAYGAAHLCYTSLPTGGENNNVVLSGHTGYVGRWLFDSIPSLKEGDEVTVKNYFGNITYKVVDKITRDPSDGQDMYIKKGKDILTLITCVPDGSGGFDRCVVVCVR